MRKIVPMMLCFLVLGSTAFALDLVIGGGGLFGLTFEEYLYTPPPNNIGLVQTTHEVKEKAYGGYAFFGLTRYMEASISVFVSNNSVVYKYFDYSSNPLTKIGEPYPGQQVGISLYGKYPLTRTFTRISFDFYPTLGLDLESTGGSLDLFGGAGGGIDIFNIFGKPNLFFRVQGLYRIGKLMLYKGWVSEYETKTTTKVPAHGPLFKLGLGWMYGGPK